MISLYRELPLKPPHKENRIYLQYTKPAATIHTKKLIILRVNEQCILIESQINKKNEACEGKKVKDAWPMRLTK